MLFGCAGVVMMMLAMLAQTWFCCVVTAAPAAQAMLAPDANAIPVWVWSDYEDNADYQTGMPGYMLLCMEALRKNAPPPRFDIRVVDKHSIRTYVGPFLFCCFAMPFIRSHTSSDFVSEPDLLNIFLIYWHVCSLTLQLVGFDCVCCCCSRVSSVVWLRLD